MSAATERAFRNLSDPPSPVTMYAEKHSDEDSQQVRTKRRFNKHTLSSHNRTSTGRRVSMGTEVLYLTDQRWCR